MKDELIFFIHRGLYILTLDETEYMHVLGSRFSAQGFGTDLKNTGMENIEMRFHTRWL